MKKTFFIAGIMLLFFVALTGCQTTSYQVEFVDYDDTVLKTELVKEGTAATPPADPQRTGYQFLGWHQSYENVTGNLRIFAVYEIQSYQVTFVNGEEILKTEQVDYKEAATAPLAPTRTGHTFTGWSVAFDEITSDLTVEATFDLQHFTVTFYDEDYSVLDTQTIAYGSGATAPADPKKEGYTFIGWSHEFDFIESNLNVIAEYEINHYTVQFLDFDGEVLKTSEVDYQSSVTPPSSPVRFGYQFTGWDKEYTNVTANLTIHALYSMETYTITYHLNNTKVSTEPTNWASKEAFLSDFYQDFFDWFAANQSEIPELSFSGGTYTLVKNGSTAVWSTVAELRALDVYVVEKTIGNFIYKPFTRADNNPIDPEIDNNYFLNTEPYRSQYQDLDRYFLNVMLTAYTSYNRGYNPASGGRVQIFFRFHQWNKGTTIIAFDSLPVRYAVEELGTAVSLPPAAPSTYTVENQVTVVDPTYEAITFLGWYTNSLGAGEPITQTNQFCQNLVLYAMWDTDPLTHRVLFLDQDGTVIQDTTIEAGASVTAPIPSNKEGYTFIGWDKEITAITHDITVTAMYEKTRYSITYHPNLTDQTPLLPTLVEYMAGDIYAIPNISFEGYFFLGWYANQEGTGEAVTHTSLGNLVLYGKWIAVPDSGEPIGDGIIEVVADETILKVNQTATLYVLNEDTYLDPSAVLFFSSDPDLATVSVTGGVLAKGLGNVTILVANGQHLATIEIRIEDLPYEVKWVGHQGAGGAVVQNTVAAFTLGAERGYYGLECDVRVAADGTYYICHDDTFLEYLFVDSTLWGKLMAGYTWAQLSAYQIKDTYGGVTYYDTLSTVADYLDVCKEYGVKAILELKWTTGINSNDQSKLGGLVELVKAHGMYEDAIFLSSMKNCLTYLRTNYPDVKVQFLSGSTTTTEANVDWCIANRFSIDAPYSLITSSLVTKMHEAGLYVNAYTVNSEASAASLQTLEVDMITTDLLGQ